MSSSAPHEQGIDRHRRDVTSAMYYLVWHCGMDYARAEAVLAQARELIRPLADAGRTESWACFRVLEVLVNVCDKGGSYAH